MAWWTVTYDIPTYEITGTIKPNGIRQVPVSDSDSSLTYVIGLTDGKLLEIKQNMWHPVNTDTILMNIEANKTYTFTCWGYQYTNAFWDIYWYPNVVGVEQVVNGNSTVTVS
jgi:hypothetical protein